MDKEYEGIRNYLIKYKFYNEIDRLQIHYTKSEKFTKKEINNYISQRAETYNKNKFIDHEFFAIFKKNFKGQKFEQFNLAYNNFQKYFDYVFRIYGINVPKENKIADALMTTLELQTIFQSFENIEEIISTKRE